MRPAVVLCSCFGTLSPALPADGLRQSILSRWPSALVLEAASLCRGDGLDDMADQLRRLAPDTVLVAACSPLARGRDALAGLAGRGCSQPMDGVDLREGCAWVHAHEPAGCLAKAVDLVSMGLAGLAGQAARLAEPWQAQEHGSEEAGERDGSVLVVGAGPAGLAAAATLARLGRPVTLADRLDRPGGLVASLGSLFPHGQSGGAFLAPLLDALADPLVTYLPRTTVSGLAGDPGRFSAVLTRDGQRRDAAAGAVILACGAMPVLPSGEYRSRELSGMVSQLELETRLVRLESSQAAFSELLDRAGVVFIQCLAARSDDRPYCSTVCCPTALKNGLRLKALAPDLPVTVLHRDVMAPGRDLEELYRRAMAAGVRFIRFDQDRPPEVKGDGRAGSVAVTDALSGRSYELPAGLVVLSTPLKPHPSLRPLALSLGMRLDGLGFACGTEPMRPLDGPVPGVFLCGSARWPVYAAQAADQGRAAGIRAAAFLARIARPARAGGKADRSEDRAEYRPGYGPGPRPGAAIRGQACSRCGRCAAVCPYGACQAGQDGAMTVSLARCQGCGACVAVCPSGAARLPGTSGPVLRAMLGEAAGRRAEP